MGRLVSSCEPRTRKSVSPFLVFYWVAVHFLPLRARVV